jgi:hypothetical protein
MDLTKAVVGLVGRFLDIVHRRHDRPPFPVDREIDDNPVKPGRELGIAAGSDGPPPCGVGPNPRERFLRDIFAVASRVHEPAGQAHGPREVPIDQNSECSLIASPYGGHERLVST